MILEASNSNVFEGIEVLNRLYGDEMEFLYVNTAMRDGMAYPTFFDKPFVGV